MISCFVYNDDTGSLPEELGILGSDNELQFLDGSNVLKKWPWSEVSFFSRQLPHDPTDMEIFWVCASSISYGFECDDSGVLCDLCAQKSEGKCLQNGWYAIATDGFAVDKKLYFCNDVTQATTWEAPSASTDIVKQTWVHNPWDAYDNSDEENPKTYFHNRDTNETVWERPACYVSPSENEEEEERGELPDGWEGYETDDDKKYYHNIHTGETSWEWPCDAATPATPAEESSSVPVEAASTAERVPRRRADWQADPDSPVPEPSSSSSAEMLVEAEPYTRHVDLSGSCGKLFVKFEQEKDAAGEAVEGGAVFAAAIKPTSPLKKEVAKFDNLVAVNGEDVTMKSYDEVMAVVSEQVTICVEGGVSLELKFTKATAEQLAHRAKREKAAQNAKKEKPKAPVAKSPSPDPDAQSLFAGKTISSCVKTTSSCGKQFTLPCTPFHTTHQS
jgi:hypothetical protein